MTLAGLVVLLFAGDALVKGAVNLSLRLGIPALIVSLTVVALGTSAPEMLVAVSAVLEHAPAIAVGNVVGSNTANILLVLGLPALISGLNTSRLDTRRSYVFMLIGSVLFIVAAFLGPITWVHGLVLLAALVFVLIDAVSAARAHRRNGAARAEKVEGAERDMRGWKIGALLGAGLIGLPLGAELLDNGSVNIAREYGVKEAVIGLTLVAVGTSLPELATTISAAIRRSADVAIGNVIGSNLFNMLAIPGIASLIGPMPVDQTFLTFDLWVMLGASLLLFPFVFGKNDISRIWGAIFVAGYGIYLFAVLA
jgi:cation:H+ antiporter